MFTKWSGNVTKASSTWIGHTGSLPQQQAATRLWLEQFPWRKRHDKSATRSPSTPLSYVVIIEWLEASSHQRSTQANVSATVQVFRHNVKQLQPLDVAFHHVRFDMDVLGTESDEPSVRQWPRSGRLVGLDASSDTLVDWIRQQSLTAMNWCTIARRRFTRHRLRTCQLTCLHFLNTTLHITSDVINRSNSDNSVILAVRWTLSGVRLTRCAYVDTKIMPQN